MGVSDQQPARHVAGRKLGVKMQKTLNDLPLGARFRYREGGQIWIKISTQGYGLIAEYDKERISNPPWVGQRLCSAVEREGDNPEVVLEES